MLNSVWFTNKTVLVLPGTVHYPTERLASALEYMGADVYTDQSRSSEAFDFVVMPVGTNGEAYQRRHPAAILIHEARLDDYVQEQDFENFQELVDLATAVV